MKCDELKPVFVDMRGNIVANELGELYYKPEVDAAIAELKAAIRIKDKLLIENGKQIGELKGELESRRQAAIDIKLSAEKVLRDLLDCGLIKEWYFNGKFNAVLKADDPHLQIAELKAENKLLKEYIANGDVSRITWIDEVIELKKKLENVQASMYADVVDANMESRRLKRALWLARAERAKESHFMWCQLIYDKKYGIAKFNVRKEWGENVKQGQMLHTPQGWADVWDEAERKCRAKAEAYK